MQSVRNLEHSGIHKLNNSIGEALLAKHMNERKVIAETDPEHAFLHDIVRVKYDALTTMRPSTLYSSFPVLRTSSPPSIALTQLPPK